MQKKYRKYTVISFLLALLCFLIIVFITNGTSGNMAPVIVSSESIENTDISFDEARETWYAYQIEGEIFCMNGQEVSSPDQCERQNTYMNYPLYGGFGEVTAYTQSGEYKLNIQSFSFVQSKQIQRISTALAISIVILTITGLYFFYRAIRK